METIDVIKMVIELVVIVVSFFLGRYALPKHKTTIQSAATQFEVLLKYAESFCSYARRFLSDYSGSKKMDNVVEKLKIICGKQGIEVDEETLKAIAQKAYDAMVAGEKSSKSIIENTEEGRNVESVIDTTEEQK